MITRTSFTTSTYLSRASVWRLAILAMALMTTGCGSGSGDPAGSGTQTTPDTQPTPDTRPENDGTSDQSTIGLNVIGDSDTNIVSQCSADSQKQWAYDAMQDFYLFYDQVPVADPLSYESTDALVRKLRFAERDNFSNVSDATQSALAFEEGREFGLGIGLDYDNTGNARITDVVRNGPMSLAGIERGDIIVSINGVAWAQAVGPDLAAQIIGTPESPGAARWEFRKSDTQELVELDITATEYSINTVVFNAVYTNPAIDSTVGYLVFSRFLQTSEAELNSAFTSLKERNISELILDLRYNGGGRVSIARQLASLIADDSRVGEPIYEYQFNDKYTENNYTLEFVNGIGNLGLNRLIVLVSNRTASAAEIVIAGLQPYMDVVTVGTTTRGKPFASRAYDRCNERLNIIEAEGVNSVGNSVFGGIAPDCHAEDDLTRDFGLNDQQGPEGQLLAGLKYLEDGTCANQPLASAARDMTEPTARSGRVYLGLGAAVAEGALLD